MANSLSYNNFYTFKCTAVIFRQATETTNTTKLASPSECCYFMFQNKMPAITHHSIKMDQVQGNNIAFKFTTDIDLIMWEILQRSKHASLICTNCTTHNNDCIVKLAKLDHVICHCISGSQWYQCFTMPTVDILHIVLLATSVAIVDDRKDQYRFVHLVHFML